MRSPLVKLALLVLLSVAAHSTYAQLPIKELGAVRIHEPITIDGNLSEPVWIKAPVATNFIQNAPNPGVASAQESAVSILYDDNAVYIGATLYDTRPDSILRQLSARDDYDVANTDVFGVSFDPYFDRQDAFLFVVTAAGVQADAKVKFDGYDYSWNAAWYSKVKYNSKGWTVEMKIPYSALRFPKAAEQKWGLNFFRTIRRTREKSYWSPVMPSISNAIGQSGVLTGMRDIQSPIRLAFLPYVSTYAEDYDGHQAHSFNGGMDIKYGINESFTLDMTLIPDFGQTLYDNKVLNLSPIEVRYDERRYFFTEGTDLFNKNDLFYSRRVGGTPVNFNNIITDTNEIITQNPASTKLYNATKISGRTKSNLGIGFFNATSAPTSATVYDTITHTSREVETSPLTNYNVIVLDQALKNNSYLSFINTNVWRQKDSYNADVCAALFRWANKANSYAIDGSTDMSQLYFPGKTDVGYRYYLDGGKTKGNYTWTLSARTVSDDFNPNDLGYLARNNVSNYSLDQSYNIYEPISVFNAVYNHVGVNYFRIFNPNTYYTTEINGNHSTTLRNYLSTGVYWTMQPFNNYDYLEPRTPGRYYQYPKTGEVGGFFSSDYRKRFALDGEANYRTFSTAGRATYYWSLSPRYRFNDKLAMVYSLQVTQQKNDAGYVDNVGSDIYFGIRDISTVVNVLDASYIFNSTMSLKLDARHYWSEAKYSNYMLLSDNGLLQPSSYNTSHDVNFNSFNAFLSYVWQFKPGSEMSIVYQNAIYYSGTEIITDYFADSRMTLQEPMSNSLSVKIIYYLDYLTLHPASRKS